MRGNLTLRSGLDLRYLMIDFANIHGDSSSYRASSLACCSK
jgi:hypothetical protein